MPAPFNPVIQQLGSVKNDQVINKFVAFVNTKKTIKNCTSTTVVDDFCDVLVKILKMKPKKKITPQKIMGLVEEMNEAAETEGWDDSQREWIINKILDLFGTDQLSKSEVPETRNWFTPSGKSLTKATMEATTKAGGVYNSRTYNDKNSKPAHWMYPLEDQQQINHSSNFVTGITYIERKHCAICWMCGKPIYVYKYTVNGKEYFFSCGQDEHVLPPGWGNILGILWSDLKDQRMYNSCLSSLRPSHAWCNQLKNDELLLLLPRFIKKIYMSFQINNEGFNRFTKKGKKWLINGNKIIDHNMFYRDLTNPPNVRLIQTQAEAAQFMQKMEQTMRAHLLELIKELEDNIVKPTAGAGNITTNHYTVFILRTTLCLAYMWNKIIYYRSVQGGGDGDHPEQDKRKIQKVSTEIDVDDGSDDVDDYGYHYDDNGYYYGYYGSRIGDEDKLMPHLYVAGLFDKNKEFDEENIFSDENTFLSGDKIRKDDDYEIKEVMTTWQVCMENMLSTGRENFNVSFMVNAFGIDNIILKVYKPQSIVIPSIKFTQMRVSSDPVTVPATKAEYMVSESYSTDSGMPPAPPSWQFVPQSMPQSGQHFGQFGQFVPHSMPQSGQQFGQSPAPLVWHKSSELPDPDFDMLRALPTKGEAEVGGKYKSQKYKSRKYKSQKYKTRKHKSQKQKNRKKHKSRKHK